MELLVELLFDLVCEGGIELSKNKKVPKYIRYPLIVLVLLVFISILFFIIFVGVLIWKENIWVAILMFAISIFFLISGIKELKKMYFEKKMKNK